MNENLDDNKIVDEKQEQIKENSFPENTPPFIGGEEKDPEPVFQQGETTIPDVTEHEVVEQPKDKTYCTNASGGYILPTPYGEYIITKEFIVTDTGLQKFIESTPEFNSGKIYLKN